MLQLSEKSLILATSSYDGWRALRRAMKLWPARESAKSWYKGEKSDSCFSCGLIYESLWVSVVESQDPICSNLKGLLDDDKMVRIYW